MSNRTKGNNILIITFFLTVITSGVLSYLWRSDFKQTGLYVLSGVFCGGSSLILGGFLLILPSSIQDKFLKNSFLIHLMSATEKESNIVKFRARAFGLMIFIFGLIVITSILYNYY